MSQAIFFGRPDLDYEISKQYAHVLISGISKDPEYVKKELQKTLKEYREDHLEKEAFERIKRKIYGEYVSEYNSVGDITKMLLYDYFRGINSFDYLEEYEAITLEYAAGVFQELFNEKNMIISIIKGK